MFGGTSEPPMTQEDADSIVLFDRDEFSDGFVLRISKVQPNARYELVRQGL